MGLQHKSIIPSDTKLDHKWLNSFDAYTLRATIYMLMPSPCYAHHDAMKQLNNSILNATFT